MNGLRTINFFQSGGYKQFDGGWYLVRNYDDFDGIRYSESYVGRMCRLTPETKFVGKIHECLVPQPMQIYSFQSTEINMVQMFQCVDMSHG